MNRATSILGGLIVVAIAVVFIVNFQPGGGQNQAQEGPDCAAEVHGKCIRAGHYWATVRLLAPRGADTDQLKRLRLRNMAMDALVERELLLQEAKRLGISVGEDDVTRELRAGRVRVSLPSATPPSLPMYLGMQEAGVRGFNFVDKKTGKFGADTYKRQVTEVTRLSETEFREFQRDEIIAARMRDVIRQRVRIADGEARQQYDREKSTRTIKYVKIERPFVAMQGLDASPEAVKKWADANATEVEKVFSSRKDRFATGCREARHILLRVDPESPTAEEDKTKAKEKLLAAKKRVEGGESFADVAREVSEDSSAVRGGKLGCMVKGQMVKPFEDAAFALAKAGDMSGLVESQFGVHLIVVDAIHEGDAAIAAGKAQAAEELYLAHEAERVAAEGAKQILAAVKGGKTLDEALATWIASLPGPKKAAEEKAAAEKKEKKGEKKDGEKAEKKDGEKADDHDDEAHDEHRPTVETSLPFNVSGEPFDGVAMGQDAASVAFGLEKVGDVPGDVVPLQGGGYAILQLEKITPADEAGWTENRDYYISAIRTQKQSEALATYMRRLRKTAQAEIKVNDELTRDPSDPAASASASAAPPSAPPMPLPLPEE